jgi:branched-chain amino acid aminotransferase
VLHPPDLFRGYGQMGLYPLDCDVSVSIAAWPWGAYLGEESKRAGIRAKVSSWRRISGDSLIPHSKASGQYLNSVLAKIEASKAGTRRRSSSIPAALSEGSGENIYIVRDGRILTPPQTAGILDGINRRSILTIANDLGYEVIERDIARAELTLADAVFFSGTAAALVPVCGSTTTGSAAATPARSRASSSGCTMTPSTAGIRATSTGSTWSRCRPAIRPDSRPGAG